MNDLISIILPTRNRTQLLGRTIESILAQTYDNWELVIVDDGSNVPLQVTSLPASNSRVTIIRQEHLGVSAARNAALAHASGDAFALIDDDDTWFPEKLEKQMRLLNEEPDTSMVIGGVLLLNVKEGTSNEDIPLPTVTLQDLFAKCCITSSTVMFRRSILRLVGLFDRELHIGETWDYWIRTAAHFKIRSVPDLVTTYYFNHGGNATQDIEGMYHYRMKVLNKHAALIQSSESYREAARLAAERLVSQYLTFRKKNDIGGGKCQHRAAEEFAAV